MSKQELDDIETLVVNNKFPEVFELLKNHPPVSEDAKRLHARYNRIEKSKLHDTISRDEYNRELAKLTESLLVITRELGALVDSRPIGKVMEPETPKELNAHAEENPELMFKTIGNNRQPSRPTQLSQRELEGALFQFRSAHEDMNKLAADSFYLSKLIKILVKVEDATERLNQHLIQTGNQQTAIAATSLAMLTKTKEALKEIAAAQRERGPLGAAEYIRNYIVPYYDQALEKIIHTTDDLVHRASNN